MRAPGKRADRQSGDATVDRPCTQRRRALMEGDSPGGSKCDGRRLESRWLRKVDGFGDEVRATVLDAKFTTCEIGVEAEPLKCSSVATILRRNRVSAPVRELHQKVAVPIDGSHAKGRCALMEGNAPRSSSRDRRRQSHTCSESRRVRRRNQGYRAGRRVHHLRYGGLRPSRCSWCRHHTAP